MKDPETLFWGVFGGVFGCVFECVWVCFVLCFRFSCVLLFLVSDKMRNHVFVDFGKQFWISIKHSTENL